MRRIRYVRIISERQCDMVHWNTVCMHKWHSAHWARIWKRLRSPGIDSRESIPLTYVAWLVCTSNRVIVPARQAGNRFLGSLKGLQIRALHSMPLSLLSEKAQWHLSLLQNVLRCRTSCNSPHFFPVPTAQWIFSASLAIRFLMSNKLYEVGL